ncbi:uncharacterized protein LOC116201101 [Punica granatum]|nr:uncharacterized protein LOC116201101 [Punica granatum]OWM76509.1 hypothetical protein CDL15_Pgr005473 [Punica granatum]
MESSVETQLLPNKISDQPDLLIQDYQRKAIPRHWKRLRLALLVTFAAFSLLVVYRNCKHPQGYMDNFRDEELGTNLPGRRARARFSGRNLKYRNNVGNINCADTVTMMKLTVSDSRESETRAEKVGFSNPERLTGEAEGIDRPTEVNQDGGAFTDENGVPPNAGEAGENELGHDEPEWGPF